MCTDHYTYSSLSRMLANKPMRRAGVVRIKLCAPKPSIPEAWMVVVGNSAHCAQATPASCSCRSGHCIFARLGGETRRQDRSSRAVSDSGGSLERSDGRDLRAARAVKLGLTRFGDTLKLSTEVLLPIAELRYAGPAALALRLGQASTRASTQRCLLQRLQQISD